MSKVMRELSCEQCGDHFFSKWDGAKYCSSACRQTAYRRRVNPESASKHDAMLRMVETKREKQRGKTCVECGKYFIVDAFHTAKEYCSNACKQRRYRRYKAWRDGYTEQPAIIKRVEIDPNDALRNQLQRAYDMQQLQEKFDSKR